MATSPRKRASAAAPAPAPAAAETPHRRATDPKPAGETQTVTAADVGTVTIDTPAGFDTQGIPLTFVDLPVIAALTMQGGFAYTDAATHQPLVASGDVEINPGVVHPSGMIGTRATAQGIAKVTAPQTAAPQAPAAPAAAPAPAAAKVEFVIETGVELPAVKRNVIGHGNTKYPFDKLEIGQSFFVPGGSVKALASTVASANERYSEVVKNPDGSNAVRTNRKGKTVDATKPIRRFVVRNDEKVNADGSKTAGARIGRVSIPAAE